MRCYDVSLLTSKLPVYSVRRWWVRRDPTHSSTSSTSSKYSTCTHSSVTAFASRDRSSAACGADMSRQRFTDDPSMGRRAPSSSSEAALDTTQLLERLARSIISERCGRRDSDAAAAPSEAQIHGTVRLCIRILTSHIGEPLMVEDEASVAQVIRTRLVKVSTSSAPPPTSIFKFSIFDMPFQPGFVFLHDSGTSGAHNMNPQILLLHALCCRRM